MIHPILRWNEEVPWICSFNKIAAPWTYRTAQPCGIDPKMLLALPLPSATDDTCTSTFRPPLLKCISGFASSRRSCAENKNAEYKTKDVELVNVLCSSVCVCGVSHLHTSVDTCTILYQACTKLVPSLYQDMPSCTSASLARCSSLGGWETWHCTSCRPRESMITQGKTV